MIAKVTVQLTTEIEVDACGEVCHEGEDWWVNWDKPDVATQVQHYITEHFGKDTDFEILEIND